MTDHAAREWRLVREESRSGPMNMALDEIAARTAAAGGPRTLRVYRWEPSTLSLGYGQDPSTVDRSFCDREGVAITRRPTGGGGIYHDSLADISYTVVAPAAEVPGDLLDSYQDFLDPVFDAFERMGVDASLADAQAPAIHPPACYLRELHPAHDVVAGDGRKISGNAQYRRRDAVVQHGSLSYDLRPERHAGVFADPGVTSAAFEERVTSIRAASGIDRAEAVAALEAALRDWADATEGDWTEAELAAARDLARGKYATDAWTWDREEST